MEKLNPKKTMWLSLIPGLGQLKNGQKAKGIIFLGIFALFIIEMAVFGFNALVGLVTLGTVAGRDHSMFLMVRGTLQFLITIIFLMFYVANDRDAKKTAEAINRGKDVPKTWK